MTEIPSGEYKFTSMSSMVFGQGSIQRLGEKMDELGARRALLITVPPIVTETDFVERVKAVLGDRLAGIFSGVVQHVPRQCVIGGARVAKEAGADILISLGGSSASDTAKGINLVLTEAERLEDFFVKFDRSGYTAPGSLTATEFKKPKLPQIAIPTTLSGGEFTAGLGITDTDRKHKDIAYSDKLTPKVVILDPEMTVRTSRQLWASTAMKSFSDCFEVVCSPRHQLFTDALALHAARLINRHLVPSITEPLDLGARAILQHAVGMVLQSLSATGAGIIATLRHQIGAIYNVEHGLASTIVFPYGIDFNRPVVAERLCEVARALDLPTKNVNEAATAAIDRARELISEVGLPRRLRDVGVPKEGIKVIVQASLEDHQIRNNPRQPVSKEQLTGVLEQAW